MKVGIVTAATGKPKRGSGLEDIVKEIESRNNVDYKIINPQNISYLNGEFRYLVDKVEDKFILDGHRFVNRRWRDESIEISLKEYTEDVDYLYIRGFKSRGSLATIDFVMRALKSLNLPTSNPFDAIRYCNNKLNAIIDIQSTNAEIDGVPIRKIIPQTKVFNLSRYELNEEVKQYVKRRLLAHKDVVLKLTDSRGGNSIMPIERGSPYRALIDNYNHPFFMVQDKIDDIVDLRVQIVGYGYCESDIKAAYIRESVDGDFRAQHNRKMEPIELNRFQKNVALYIHRLSGAHISAIDFGLNQETNNVYFFEINGENPGWKNLKKIFDLPRGLAPVIVDFIINNYSQQKK
ncbi:MAG: hypothetical protein J7K22_04140 [Nanoarchaeota archaeon]|nr:hypothetical protein [Nanoarchaeota archaeon]